MSLPNTSSNNSTTIKDPLVFCPNVQVSDRMVIVVDFTAESEEVSTAIVEGITLPQDRSHLEGITNEEIITYTLTLSVIVRHFH